MPTVTGKANSFISFSRPGAAGGGATVIDSDGKIKWAAHNLLLASEQLNASPWSANSVSLSPNSTAAPNGTLTADGITANGSNNPHYLQYIASWTWSPVKYTLGIFAKKDTNRYLWFGAYDGTTGYSGVWDIQVGVYVGNSSTSGPATGAILEVGGGWYLCTISFTPAAGTTPYPVAAGTNNTGSLTENADTSTGRIFLWGAHLYRSDLAGMQPNASTNPAFSYYNSTTPKNLIGYTENFASWPQLNAPVVTSNIAIAPNQLQTASRIEDSSASLYQGVRQSFSGVQNTPYVASIYIQKSFSNSYPLLQFAQQSANNWCGIILNTSTGTANAVTGANYFAPAAFGFVDAGNYWRVWIRFAANATATWLLEFYPAASTDGSTISATATGSSVIWGAQVTDSASIDPYVPNFGAAPSSAAYYGPRLDHDPVTLAPKGLLVEEARTNTLTYSHEFVNGAWVKDGISVSTSAVLAPDRTNPASKLTEKSGSASDPRTGFYIRQVSNGLTTGQVGVLSAYVKAAERTQVALGFIGTNSVPMAAIIVDLSSLSVVGRTYISPGNIEAALLSAEQVGDGWVKIAVLLIPASGISCSAYIATASGGSVNYTGNGTAGLYVWGAQLEPGTFATSYIPTGAATATRGYDVANLNVAQFPYNVSEGSLVVHGSFNAGANTSAYFIHLGGGAGGTGYGSSHGIFRGNVSSLGSGQRMKGITFDDANNIMSECVTSSDVNTTPSKAAYGYAANNFGFSVNGGAVIQDTNGALPSSAWELTLGSIRAGNGSALNGHIRQVTYLPRRLSNAELQVRAAA